MIYTNNGHCCFFPRGHAEVVVVRSSLGDAVDGNHLRLAWVVSAWPRSPRSMEREGTGRALTGRGEQLLQLKLEKPEKGTEEEMEGHLAGSCLLLQARKSLPLWVRKGPSS